MKTFQEMSRQELEEMHSKLTVQFEEIKAEGLKLDMSRGNRRRSSLTRQCRCWTF